MAARRWPKLAILHKIETVEGTSAAPTAANAIIASNVTFTPLQATEESRDLMLPYMGNQGLILTEEYGRIEFDVEIAGAGAAGTVPQYGSILRAAGMAETITAATDVTYSLVESSVESGTIFFNSDGVQHIFLGGRANVALNLNAAKIPKFRVTYNGLLGTVTDVALPAVTAGGLIKPVVVSKANTVLTMHGWTAIAESISFDLGNDISPLFQIGAEEVPISNRSSTGTAVIRGTSVADFDVFGIVRARTRDEVTLTHGTTAGNIVEVTCPAVELGAPSVTQIKNIVHHQVGLSLCPVNGLDEITITVR